MDRLFLTPEDVAEGAGISVEQARELVKQLGKHLKNANVAVVPDRIQVWYYEKQKEEGFILSGKELIKTEQLPVNQKRLLGIHEFYEYVGLGKDKAMELAEDAGVLIRIGRQVKIDRVKFDYWCDENSGIEDSSDTCREPKAENADRIAVLSENDSGWRKEVSLLSWDDGPLTYDIREWYSDYEQSGEGISLLPEEWTQLVAIAGRMLKSREQRKRKKGGE